MNAHGIMHLMVIGITGPGVKQVYKSVNGGINIGVTAEKDATSQVGNIHQSLTFNY